MDQLAGLTDIIVVAVNLDQTGIVPGAVHIVEQAAVLGNDAVLGLLQNELAVVRKLIAGRGQQAVVLGDPVIGAVDHLAAVADVVVIAVNLDQTGIAADVIHVIIQAAVLGNDAVLGLWIAGQNHAALLVKLVAALGEGIAVGILDGFRVGLADPVSAANDVQAGRIVVVVAPVGFLYQAQVNANTVDVGVAVFLQPLPSDVHVLDGSGLGKGVGPHRQQVVGPINPGALVLQCLVVLAKVEVFFCLGNPDQAGILDDLAVFSQISVLPDVGDAVGVAAESAGFQIKDVELVLDLIHAPDRRTIRDIVPLAFPGDPAGLGNGSELSGIGRRAGHDSQLGLPACKFVAF